jgi:maltooligosyltrehalose trehalohydrolase
MAIKRINEHSLGVSFNDANIAHISLWAPLVKKVAVGINDDTFLDLTSGEHGYWHLDTNQLIPGNEYVFLLDDHKKYPDPASLFQPDGVAGKSKAVKLSDYKWNDNEWRNPDLDDYIFYELHTGTFTPEGTFAGILEKLDYLKSLGITAIEIMPVAQFSGERNWGYDCVFPFAVQNSYGGPEGLSQLVDKCHQKGLAVVLDVVYNHLGPEGNCLPFFGPYFTEKYRTPWGNAINFDDAWCDGVRNYFIQNALMWFRDFHIDALRLDAVHAIKDFSPKHILQEMKEKVAEFSVETGKKFHLIVECDLNDPRFLDPLPAGLNMDAQWVDEFHHALRVTSGQEKTGYYSDFTGITDLAKAYTA